MILDTLFYIFSGVLVGSSLSVALSRDPIYSVLSLVLCFLATSCLWFILGAEFLALLIVIVYVGAVMVLFVFVIMMIDTSIESKRSFYYPGLIIGFIGSIILGYCLISTINIKALNIAFPTNIIVGSSGKDLGICLYTRYAYSFEIAAALLVAAVVIAVAIVVRHNDTKKRQSMFYQVRASKSNLRMVKVRD